MKSREPVYVTVINDGTNKVIFEESFDSVNITHTMVVGFDGIESTDIAEKNKVVSVEITNNQVIIHRS